MEQAWPTPEDFANLISPASTELTQRHVEEFRKMGLPGSYEDLCMGLDPTQDSLREVTSAIGSDEGFTLEARGALGMIVFERWQNVVESQAGEGFND